MEFTSIILITSIREFISSIILLVCRLPSHISAILAFVFRLKPNNPIDLISAILVNYCPEILSKISGSKRINHAACRPYSQN